MLFKCRISLGRAEKNGVAVAVILAFLAFAILEGQLNRLVSEQCLQYMQSIIVAGTDRGEPPSGNCLDLDPAGTRHGRIPVGHQPVHPEFPPARRVHGNLRGGQAVDVEIAASRRRRGDQ